MKIDYIIKKVESAGFNVEQNRRNGYCVDISKL